MGHDEPLANPELRWERARDRSAVTVEELERCLGAPLTATWSVLPGGLANTNVKVGDRVVRIYRRDPRAAALEASLLARPWRSFRVPAVLRAGPGFLVCEHVPHGPLLGSAEHGAAAGRALAEVHAIRFADAGDLDTELRVVAPFGDLVGVFLAHARGELGERAIRTLERLAPGLRAVADGPVLLHADFKSSNLHWTADDRLLVLDWEFAYAGAALSDVGQLLRWSPPEAFTHAFATAYQAGGRHLVEDWPRWAAAFDLFNLAGLLANQRAVHGDTRIADVTRRIQQTLDLFD